MSFSLIMGKNCLMEVLKAKPGIVLKIYTAKKEDPLIRQAFSQNIPVKIVPSSTLTDMTHSDSHQGFVAQIKERHYNDLKTVLPQLKKQALLLMCDGITDPHNFGAILRTAECFGVDGVIFSKNRGVDVTPVVTKTSVGASEIVPLIRVSNLAETMKLLQSEGFSAIVADVDAKSKPLQTFKTPERTLLILGAEGRGVQPLLKRKADFSVHIPLFGQIDSLNVSQAAAIFLNHLKGYK